MKIEVNNGTQSSSKIIYPRLVLGKASGNTYLQLANSQAVCLVVGEGNHCTWKAGELHSKFDDSDCIPFTGSITLSND